MKNRLGRTRAAKQARSCACMKLYFIAKFSVTREARGQTHNENRGGLKASFSRASNLARFVNAKREISIYRRHFALFPSNFTFVILILSFYQPEACV